MFVREEDLPKIVVLQGQLLHIVVLHDMNHLSINEVSSSFQEADPFEGHGEGFRLCCEIQPACPSVVTVTGPEHSTE